MKALVLGATGATGKDLVALLLADPRFSQVVTFGRRSSGRSHPKLTEHFVDFNHPASWKNLVQGDVAFSCLGTTLKDAGSKENQRKTDVEIPFQFAIAARENQVAQMILVSAKGANPRSFFFYLRLKGELEEKIKNLKFNNFTIFQPGLLYRKNSTRTGEKLSVNILRFLNKFGILKSQKPLPTECLAKAMLKASQKNDKRFSLIQSVDIFNY